MNKPDNKYYRRELSNSDWQIVQLEMRLNAALYYLDLARDILKIYDANETIAIINAVFEQENNHYE